VQRLLIILLIGLLSGLSEGLSGAGWGVLSLILLVSMDVNPLVAVTSSILVELILGVENNLLHFKLGYFNWKIALPLLATGCIGVYFGSKYSAKIPEQSLKLVIGCLVVFFGTITMIKALRG